MNEIERMVEDLLELHRHEHFATWTDEEHEKYILLKKQVIADLSNIDEYKTCKQYWYDKCDVLNHGLREINSLINIEYQDKGRMKYDL